METCTQGHVIGMLDRDQRTAKMWIFNKHVVIVRRCLDLQTQIVITRRNKTLSHRSVPGRTSPHSRCKTRKNGHFWKSLPRLKPALFVSYLVLLAFPGVLSAPTTKMSSSSSWENTTPKWHDPCGIGAASGGLNDARNTSSEDSTAMDFMEKIVYQARVAESRASSFTDKFVAEGFNMNVKKVHTIFANQDYKWLPTDNMEKKWKQRVSQEHLETLEYETTLISVYRDLQKIAVGIEQIVRDESELHEEFFASENQLNVLLCEIHTAILDKGLKFGENVSREIMDPQLRHTSNKTDMFIRNWIIYRDYMNMLEYVIEVFEHLKTKLSKQNPSIE